MDPTHHCPTCGHEVTLMHVDEGTTFYMPVPPGADGDATNMAVAIGVALKTLDKAQPSVADVKLACAALRGALSAHRERIGS
jgi:hypothetical protein